VTAAHQQLKVPIIVAGSRVAVTVEGKRRHMYLELMLRSRYVAVCVCVQGDAEDLPFAADSFDRYVSAGSIEYWPEPQRGITEAYRVTKPGGVACIIGPVYPTHPLSR
jgi:SAM-dependent methyltransferase